MKDWDIAEDQQEIVDAVQKHLEDERESEFCRKVLGLSLTSEPLKGEPPSSLELDAPDFTAVRTVQQEMVDSLILNKEQLYGKVQTSAKAVQTLPITLASLEKTFNRFSQQLQQATRASEQMAGDVDKGLLDELAVARLSHHKRQRRILEAVERFIHADGDPNDKRLARVFRQGAPWK